MAKESFLDIESFACEVAGIVPELIKGMFRLKPDTLGRGKVTVPQFLALDLILQKGRLKMRDIAEGLNVSLPAATGIIERLYKMNMVERVYDSRDRRVVRIKLTLKGRKAAVDIRNSRKQAIKEVFGKLTPRERRDYLNILRKIKDILYNGEKA